MPLPDFTHDERYLVESAKSPRAAYASSSYMYGYVLPASFFAGIAAYQGSVPMLLTAFVVVCGFRIYEERHQARWLPVWRSVIDKYEAAVLEAQGSSGCDSSS
ncbi:MAG: hypothetical protein H6821_03725 [Planctomycetaceae bacterium]|nr:hypothetical protein [Planctomycetales bacterium]MCB9873266.1 hypothetical protein [Planctomycetaceae bacterium]MCB9939435.1 hypothetical protein [Planctomycetaceae bacterium]HRX80484.1 hypothetical protein [Pirellulaceae bacterium]